MLYKVNLHVTGTIEVDDQTEQVVQTKLDLSETNVAVQDDLITQLQYFFLSKRGYTNEELGAMTKWKAQSLIGDIKQKEAADEKRKELAAQQKQLKEREQAASISKKALPWEQTCSVEGCENKVTTKGMCNKHYQIEHKRKRGNN